MDRFYFFIVLFLCLGILTGTFSLYYLESNISYDNFIHDNIGKFNNVTFEESALKLSSKNMEYNFILKIILALSVIDIGCTLPFFILRKNLNRINNIVIDGESHRERDN